MAHSPEDTCERGRKGQHIGLWQRSSDGQEVPVVVYNPLPPRVANRLQKEGRGPEVASLLSPAGYAERYNPDEIGVAYVEALFAYPMEVALRGLRHRLATEELSETDREKLIDRYKDAKHFRDQAQDDGWEHAQGMRIDITDIREHWDDEHQLFAMVIPEMPYETPNLVAPGYVIS